MTMMTVITITAITVSLVGQQAGGKHADGAKLDVHVCKCKFLWVEGELGCCLLLLRLQ